MPDYKIIISGPVGAGKTTAISVLSDIPPIITDEAASDMTLDRKQRTTVALDYGRMQLGESERVHLYGTPGQERFSFMWEILTEGGIGLVLLIDNTRKEPFRDLQFFLDSFKSFIDSTSVTIGVTRMDEKASPAIDDYHQHITSLGWPKLPILEVDAREREDMSLLVQSLLYSLDPTLAG
ncbi:MAG: ATP/GTP-binding protein [Candidatus Thiodiazotropha sp.]|jgi:signal recognition particle receptor subunit beta